MYFKADIQMYFILTILPFKDNVYLIFLSKLEQETGKHVT